MSRIMIPMVLVLILNLMGVGGLAMAFTLRFGPVSVAEDPASIHHTTDAAIPTPRLFNVSVGADGVTFGPKSIAPKVTVAAPAIRLRHQTQSRVTEAQSTPRVRSRTSPRQLSGVEIMLLRHTKQVAER